MVYLHFPSNLTEEELMLQAKYAKLKKKKKALQALKAPKQEPEKPLPTKRGTEARDAREIARKLLKSGAIQAIKTPPPLPQNATFKRPRAGRERKLSLGIGPGVTTGGVASYQPFSASQEPPVDEETTPRVKYLYESFVSPTQRFSIEQDHKYFSIPLPDIFKDKKPKNNNERTGPVVREEKPLLTPKLEQPPPHGNTKQRGNTLAVTGARTEEALRRRVASYTPVQLTFHADTDKGYVTFETVEIAARALTDLDGSPGEDDSTLHAVYARRPRDPPPPPAWAGSHQQKPQKDAKRSLLTYDDIFE